MRGRRLNCETVALPLSTVLSVLSLTLAVGLFLSGCGGSLSEGEDGRIYAYNHSAVSVESCRIPGTNIYVLDTDPQQTASSGAITLKEGQPGATGPSYICRWASVGGAIIAPLGAVGPIRLAKLTFIAAGRDGHGVWTMIGRSE